MPFFATLPHLRTIGLSSCKLGAQGCMAVAKAVKKRDGTNVDLTYNGVDSDSAEAVALPNIPGITVRVPVRNLHTLQLSAATEQGACWAPLWRCCNRAVSQSDGLKQRYLSPRPLLPLDEFRVLGAFHGVPLTVVSHDCAQVYTSLPPAPFDPALPPLHHVSQPLSSAQFLSHAPAPPNPNRLPDALWGRGLVL